MLPSGILLDTYLVSRKFKMAEFMRRKILVFHWGLSEAFLSFLGDSYVLFCCESVFVCVGGGGRGRQRERD